MRQLLKFVFLSLTATISSAQEDCGELYQKIGSKCLTLTIVDNANFREQTCHDGLKGFIGHFDSDVVDEMAEFLRDRTENTLREYFFIGIQFKGKAGDYSGKKKWRYIDNDEEIGDDYPLWADGEPKNGRECAAVSREREYQVVSQKCGDKWGYICSSDNEDCGGQSYINSEGLCVHAVNGDSKFNDAVNNCKRESGILIPLKDESDRKKIIPAIHTSIFKGGICMDLEEKDGQWTYRDGTSPPADLWDDRIPKKWDCGAIKIMEDWSIKIHTLKCSNDFQCICQQRG